MQTFTKGQKVLYRRSILCGRAPEFGVIVKRHAGEHGDWYVVRDADRSGKCSEHATMISDASEGWMAREVETLRQEAADAMRQSNENVVMRYKADALTAVAERLAA